MNATRSTVPHSSKTTNVVYWITTALVALMMLQGGVFEILHNQGSVEVMRALGYPDYLNTILGIAKLLGVAAILLPVPRTLREWAYAGFTFDVGGAIASFVESGQVNVTLLIPIVSLALVLTSYWMWRRHEAMAGMTASPPSAHGLAAASA
ncbi:MAG: DoxX family protein [Gemmatimonadota bacterium]|nr:DoxX family protein [Gemmatimonadota bacterium]